MPDLLKCKLHKSHRISYCSQKKYKKSSQILGLFYIQNLGVKQKQNFTRWRKSKAKHHRQATPGICHQKYAYYTCSFIS